jgi:hypothetical protein
MNENSLNEVKENLRLLKEATEMIKTIQGLDFEEIKGKFAENVSKSRMGTDINSSLFPERYDLANGLHVEDSDRNDVISIPDESCDFYVSLAAVLSDDGASCATKANNEVVFLLGGKEWHFSLVKEACESKVLSIVMRLLHDMFQSGRFVDTQGELKYG